MPNFKLAIFFSLLLSNQGFSQDSYWNIDEALDSIPSDSVSGAIWGHPFDLLQATFNDAALVLESIPIIPNTKSGSHIAIFVDVVNGPGQWKVSPNTEGRLPGVHVRYRSGDRLDMRILMLNYDYSMNLIIDETSEDQVRGRIHLSLPDYKLSYIVGSFTADRTVP